jgi:hypothetical protein
MSRFLKHILENDVSAIFGEGNQSCKWAAIQKNIAKKKKKKLKKKTEDSVETLSESDICENYKNMLCIIGCTSSNFQVSKNDTCPYHGKPVRQRNGSVIKGKDVCSCYVGGMTPKKEFTNSAGVGNGGINTDTSSGLSDIMSNQGTRITNMERIRKCPEKGCGAVIKPWETRCGKCKRMMG